MRRHINASTLPSLPVTDSEPASPAARRSFYVLLVALTVGLFEIGSLAATTFLTRQGWMAHIPDFTPEEKSAYLTQRDPTLGWAYVTDSTWGSATDARGRITRAVPRRDSSPTHAGQPCVSTYGDSFVYGSEVENDATYPHFLSGSLGCPVRNFGVPGFGSDQAVMLFRAQAAVDTASVVVFQHLTENILRNVNRYANLLYPGGTPRFKPRFILDARDSLRYLPPPVASAEDFDRLRANPDSVLEPDGMLRRPRPSFPYTVSLLAWLATDLKLRARFTGMPAEAAFYDPHHPDRGVALTVAILASAVRQAASEGRTALIVLQPTRQALIHAQETGRWVDQPLHDTLRARGLNVVHTGQALLGASGARGPCALFENCAQTHLNAEGNRVVANVIAAYLEERGLAPAMHRRPPPSAGSAIH